MVKDTYNSTENHRLYVFVDDGNTKRPHFVELLISNDGTRAVFINLSNLNRYCYGEVYATVFNLLEEILFSEPPYRKSIWFFIILWVLTFFFRMRYHILGYTI